MNIGRCDFYITLWTVFGVYLTTVVSQCTFQPPFNNSVWYDNTKGSLTFDTQYMTGWTYTSNFQTVNTWQCVNNAVDNFLIMRTQSTFRYKRSSGSVVNLYGYLCLQLTNITDTSYIYYQMQLQINEIGERMKLSPLGTLNYTDVCSNTVEVPASEYHVLVKSGFEATSGITCPNNLLFTGDYTYQHNDTSPQSCDTSADLIDVCSNNSTIAFNYTTCSQQIAYSAGGVLLCVANVNSGGYDYVTLLNMDSTFTTATSRFSCMSTDGSSASVAMGNCTATQTPYKVPTTADGTTVTGHLLLFINKYSTCGVEETTESSGLTGGQIAAIIICLLFAFFTFISFVVCVVGCLCTAAVCFLICDDLAADSEKLKSPVSLPDIGTELQNLKLKQENFMNGGPLNDNKKKSMKLKLHEGRSKTVLPPLTDRKGKTPRDGTTVAKGKSGENTSNVVKSRTGNEHTGDGTKARNNEDMVLKIESDRTGSKKEMKKDKHIDSGPGGSPRKLDIIETIGVSPRKSYKVERKVPA